MPTPHARPLPLPGLEVALDPPGTEPRRREGGTGDQRPPLGPVGDGGPGRERARAPAQAEGQGPAAASTIPPSGTLLAWADELALEHFGRPFTGSVAWAPRLRYRAGDFTPATGRIRLSLPYFARYGPAEARGILLHELCHWWLYGHGFAHREDAPAFQALLRAVGAPAKARPMPRAPRARPYVYACPGCGERYRYSRRVDYACGRCCRTFAAGRYDPRFRLRLVDAPQARSAAQRQHRRAGPATAGRRGPTPTGAPA